MQFEITTVLHHWNQIHYFLYCTFFTADVQPLCRSCCASLVISYQNPARIEQQLHWSMPVPGPPSRCSVPTEQHQKGGGGLVRILKRVSMTILCFLLPCWESRALIQPPGGMHQHIYYVKRFSGCPELNSKGTYSSGAEHVQELHNAPRPQASRGKGTVTWSIILELTQKNKRKYYNCRSNNNSSSTKMMLCRRTA